MTRASRETSPFGRRPGGMTPSASLNAILLQVEINFTRKQIFHKLLFKKCKLTLRLRLILIMID